MIKNISEKFKLFVFFISILLLFAITAYFTYNLAESKAYDFMLRNSTIQKLPFDTKKQVYGHDNIVLVVINEKSVEKYRWPWKRELYSKILTYFYQYAHAKVIVHDAIINALDIDNPQSDIKFFNAVKNTPNLVEGFMPTIDVWGNEQQGREYDKIILERHGIKLTDNAEHTDALYESLIKYPKPYLDVVKTAGSVLIIPSPISGNLSPVFLDETIRNNEYIFRYNGGYLGSVGFKVFQLVKNFPETILYNNHIDFPDLNYKIKIKKCRYQFINPIKYYKLLDNDVYSHINYSAVDIMDSYDLIKAGKKPLINPEIFRDKIVIIGAYVPSGGGLNDSKKSPITNNHPGVDIQATVIDNILNNDFLKVVPDWANLLISLAFILLIFFCIKTLSLFKSVLSTVFTIISYILICFVCFYFGIVINIITPIVMFVLTTILAYTYKYFLENKSKEKVKTAMGKYMSEDVMKSVVQNIDNLGLGGKKSVVTVLFSDIRGFTSLSEKMSAQQVSELLNEYFTEMEPIITKHNGVINKFIGDAIMAIFGEPIQDENHVKNSVKCGYEMLEKVKKLNRKWAIEHKPEIEIGIGINSGEVFVGNIGSINRMEYTVIGDTVNLASRLESYNKVYKTKMLISPSVYKEVKGFTDALKIPDVQIRGKANKMDIYEVLRVHTEK